MTKQAIAHLNKILNEAHTDNVKLDVEFKPKDLIAIIKLLNTADSNRGACKGYGSYYMLSLCKWADKHKIKLALSPSYSMGATSVRRLNSFYKTFDFIYNKGVTVDDTHNQDMYRNPRYPSIVK